MFLACRHAWKTVTHTTKHKCHTPHDGMHWWYGLLSSNNTTMMTHMVSEICKCILGSHICLSRAAFWEELPGWSVHTRGSACCCRWHGANIMNSAKNLHELTIKLTWSSALFGHGGIHEWENGKCWWFGSSLMMHTLTLCFSHSCLPQLFISFQES
jgi:hypothetical protein